MLTAVACLMVHALIALAPAAGEPATRATSAPAAEGRLVPLLRDPGFQKGFLVLDPRPGKRVPQGKLSPHSGRHTPAWDLAQWSSRFSLAGTKPEKLPGKRIRFADKAKAVTLGPARGPDRGTEFTIHTGQEYGSVFWKPGMPWAHLLVQQTLAAHPAVSELTGLRFHIEFRLSELSEYPLPEGVGDQTAQFLAYLTIQNRNRKSPGFGDYLWFGVPMFDSRYPQPHPHAALDKGTGKFIYNPPGKTYTDRDARAGQWITIDHDLLPLIHEGLQTAWQQGFLKDSRNLADLRLGGFNIGWEMPGKLDVSMQIRDLSIQAVLPKAKSSKK